MDKPQIDPPSFRSIVRQLLAKDTGDPNGRTIMDACLVSLGDAAAFNTSDDKKKVCWLKLAKLLQKSLDFAVLNGMTSELKNWNGWSAEVPFEMHVKDKSVIIADGKTILNPSLLDQSADAQNTQKK